jgi:hypothetical protein
MVKYQSILCKNPCDQLEIVKIPNPATLLWIDSGLLEHDCLEIIDEVFCRWPDLTDHPISHLDVAYFTDGNSFIWDGTRFAEYTDSKYTFTTIHVHGALYKKEGTLTQEEKVLKMGKKF